MLTDAVASNVIRMGIAMRRRVWISVGAVAAVAAAVLTYAAVQATQRSTAGVFGATGTADSRELYVMFGPCSMGWETFTDETRDTVTVRVLLDGHLGRTCTAEAVIATVTLDSPLGDRRVVDAATGHTVRVEGRD